MRFHGFADFQRALLRTRTRHELSIAVSDLGHGRQQALGGVRPGAQVHALRQGDVRHFKAAGPGANDGTVGRVLAGHDQHGRHHGAGVQSLQHRFRHEAFGHAGGRRRGQAVHADVVFLALDRERLHQARQSHLGRTVVGLTKITVQATR